MTTEMEEMDKRSKVFWDEKTEPLRRHGFNIEDYSGREVLQLQRNILAIEASLKRNLNYDPFLYLE